MEDPERVDEMDRILARFGDVQEEYEHLGGYALEGTGPRGYCTGWGLRTTRLTAT